MSTILSTNVVKQQTKPVVSRAKVYDGWGQVPHHLRASGSWRGEGRGIKKGEKPKAFVEIDERLLKYHHSEGNRIGLYDLSQTYVFTEPKRSKWLLIDRFVARNDLFGMRRVGEERPRHWRTDYLYGSVGELVYRSFNYRNCFTGVPTRFRYEGDDIYADAFYVLAPKYTGWFVLDLDNHEPTRASTKAHLLLVKHLVMNMPQIAKRIGATSVFYDYAMESPQGIHIWFALPRRHHVEALHASVEAVLQQFADPALNAMLKKNHLKTMDSLEILPTEGQLIRMFGTYDRRVFTTEELQPKNEGFDAEALLDHMLSKSTSGDPCVRYAKLAIAGLGDHIQECPPSISISPIVHVLLSSKPTQASGYFSHLVEACLNGVEEKDVLFEYYLSPIAQALYWREFGGQPISLKAVENALGRWIDRKHNQRVTRINKGRRKELDAVIRYVVKKLPSTPSGIRSFWQKVVANDLAYPQQKVGLLACIDAEVPAAIKVTKQTLKALPSLLANSSLITKQDTYNVKCIPPPTPLSLPSSLPPALEASLRTHLLKVGKRRGKYTDRVVSFAHNLLCEIGISGTRTIAGKRMNKLANLGEGRTVVKTYKKLVVGAGILRPGSERTYSKAAKRAARYDLTDIALDELRKHWKFKPSVP